MLFYIVCSMGSSILEAIVGGVFGPFSRRRQRKQDELLRSAEISDLASMACQAIRYEGWDRFSAGTKIVNRVEWTDRELFDALEELWCAATDEDKESGKSGRESNYFELYDCGLAGIIEALTERLGLPQGDVCKGEC